MFAAALGCQPGSPRVAAQDEPREEKSLAAALRGVIDRPEFRHSEFGIDILSLETGQHLWSLNAEKYFPSGSTAKLLTAATALDALDALGDDFRFRTRVYRTGPIRSDGTLEGDIVLVASGDPNLSQRIRSDGTLAFENRDHDYLGPPVPGDPLVVMRNLAAQVASKGIKRVRGRVLVDASLYPERQVGAYFVSPFAVNDNAIDVAVQPGATVGAPAIISSSPATPYLNLINQVTTSEASAASPPNAPPMPTLNWGTDTPGRAGAHDAVISGSIGLGKTQPEYFPYQVREPRRFGEIIFAQLLDENGVACAREVEESAPDPKVISAAYVPEQVVAEHVSVALAEEVRLLLKVSQNLHAYMLEELLGAQGGGEKHQSATELKRQLLARLGVDRSGAQKLDAVGAETQLTPEFMVAFLAKMAKHRSAASFMRALPVLGRDGTLADVQPASPAAGHVFAKTGTNGSFDPLNETMFVSKALAGYITSAAGRKLAFAVYVRDVRIENWSKLNSVGDALGELATLIYQAN